MIARGPEHAIPKPVSELMTMLRGIAAMVQEHKAGKIVPESGIYTAAKHVSEVDHLKEPEVAPM